jgi:sucrose phosphorylase
MKNQVQLITYVDRLGGSGVQALQSLLTAPGAALQGVFGAVHLLPFFHPIDGSDAGFDPIDHTLVDPRLGDWSDVQRLTGSVDVMADVIVNHMSSDSPQFRDYMAHGSASQHAGLFLTFDAVFPKGATEADLLALYRPRPGLPFTAVTLANGQRKILWTTFTAQQVDINVQHPQGRAYLQGILQTFADNGIRMVRLDAVGYALKKAGASGFMMPETFAFIDEFAAQAKALGIEVLVEIHSYYQRQIEIAHQVDWVYDFALPPLVLHAFFFKTAEPLKRWIAVRPSNALTVLDTHDGIGIIDIGADASDRAHKPGLVPPAELDALARRPAIWTCTKSTAPSMTHWRVTTRPICWHVPSSSSCPVCRRFTTWACWPVSTTWPCWKKAAWAATSTASISAPPTSPQRCKNRW